MKTTLPKSIYTILLSSILFMSYSNAQIGIGTTTPNGILELKSDTLGLVLPKVSLTKSNLAAPVINPTLGVLPVGTVVYNVNTTFSGSYDVSPGIYMWNGTDWINEFPKKHAQIFKQDIITPLRTRSNEGYLDVTDLVNKTFVARYTGTYKIELSVNYGGGYAQNLAGGKTNPLAQKGNFKFTFDGVDHIFPLSAHSTYGTIQYYLIWEQATIILYEELVAGSSYNFSLQFDQLDSPGFVNDGNSGTGMGYIGYDIPCSVEFIYLD